MDPKIRAGLLAGELVYCPNCDRRVKLDGRSVDLAMCLGLITIYREVGMGLADIPVLFPSKTKPSTVTTLKHWGLILQRPDLNEQRVPKLYPNRKSDRTSYWMLTERGREFVTCRIRIPLKAHVYNDECYRFSGPKVSIKRVLLEGEGFSYEELMRS